MACFFHAYRVEFSRQRIFLVVNCLNGTYNSPKVVFFDLWHHPCYFRNQIELTLG